MAIDFLRKQEELVMEPIKEIKITYPKIFTKSLREQLTYYWDKKTNRIQKIILKKLIEDLSMKEDVYPTLLKIKDVKIPDTTPTTNVEPIALYLHYSINLRTI